MNYLVELGRLLDKQLNSFIILNEDREAIFINKQAKEVFKIEISMFIGNFINCQHKEAGEEFCDKPKCLICKLNRVIDEVLITNESQDLEDLNFENKTIQTLSIRISKLDSMIMLELYNININFRKNNFLAKLAESSSDMVMFKNKDLAYEYVNASAVKFFKHSYDEIIGKSDSELLIPDLANKCLRSDLITLQKGRHIVTESFDDTYYRVSKEVVEDGILVMVRDVTKEIEMSSKMNQDSLTGIYNRTRFMECINDLYLTQTTGYYLVIIDLDNLRELNNELGHLVGDVYLCALAEILMSSTNGYYFRLGGDEFTGLISGDQIDVIKEVETLINQLTKIDLNPKLSISLGGCPLDLNKTYIENFQRADELLYQVKKQGKKGYLIEA